jgi:two-component system, NtrC family, nitrogen regulation sensor histidine kinase NtrY
MDSDSLTSRALPVTWRAILGLGLAVLIAHLALTTQYYATIAVLAAVAVTLIFGAARLLVHDRSVRDNLAANRVIAHLQQDQKTAAQRLDHLEALLDTVPAALMVLDGDGRATLANRSARILARGSAGHLADIAAIGPEAAVRMAGLAPGARAVLRLANGQQMLVSVGHFAGAGTGAQRLLSLQSVTGDLDAVQLKAWQDMTRVLAHEMMNSLTPIASLSESLSGMLRDAGGDAAEAAGTIARRAQGLAGFVERYRQLAQLPEPRRKTIVMKDFIAGTDALMRTSLGGIAYASKVEPDDLVLVADSELLSQALLNLLHNAVDAVKDCSNPAIALTCTREEAELVIAIADNGAGVTPGMAEDIFVPFFTTKPSGSGIGLSLAHQIVLAHGGKIEIAQAQPRGAIFRLSLPA